MVLDLKENVYRPGSGVSPPFFAGRQRELDAFVQRLESTKQGFSMHLAVLGDYAIGKTVLLKKFEETAGKSCFTYSCVAGAESTPAFFSSLIRGMSLKLAARFGEPLLKRVLKKASVSELKIGAFGVEGALKFESPGQTAFSFKEFLSKTWQELKAKTGAIVILIDDLDAMDDFKTAMMTLRNAGMELSDECKIMIVISGTPKLYEKMYDAHAPLVRFFEPLEIEHLTPEEARLAITKPAENVGVRFEEKVVEKIIAYSCGQPYYLQEICYHVFDAASGKTIALPEFELGFERAFSDISRSLIEKKTKELSKNEAAVLSLFEPKKPRSYTEISEEAAKKGIKKTTAITALTRLKKKGFVKQIGIGEYKGKYAVNDSLLLLFLKRLQQIQTT